MALALDPARLLRPVSTDSPSGEDLDEAGDLAFINGMAQVEAQFPTAYLTRDEDGLLHVFDRTTIDFARESALLIGLLERTRDLRLLALLARLSMLNRDLPGFGQALASIAALLEAQWDTVHPRGDGDGFELRSAILQTLEDLPTIILPLQHLPLFHSRRYGSIDFRTLMIADGEAPSRSDEPGPDRAALERSLAELDSDTLQPLRDELTSVVAACDAIASSTLARAGLGGSVRLAHLREFVCRILEFTKGPETEPDGSANSTPDELAEAPVGRDPVITSGTIATGSQASIALAAAAAYLRSHEPSSPSEVLVRQAQALLGKSFVDVMRILMPNQAPEAMIVLGIGRGLRLSFDQLAAVPDDRISHPAPGLGNNPGEQPADPVFEAASRAEAVALMRHVGSYLRRAEPASPVPLLLDKAMALADRDFLTILKDVFPEG